MAKVLKGPAEVSVEQANRLARRQQQNGENAGIENFRSMAQSGQCNRTRDARERSSLAVPVRD